MIVVLNGKKKKNQHMQIAKRQPSVSGILPPTKIAGNQGLESGGLLALTLREESLGRP